MSENDPGLFDLPPSALAGGAPSDKDLVRIRGEVERVVFTSEDGAYSVIQLRDNRGRQITAVGPIGGSYAGQELEAIGRWEDHHEYGKQLRAVQFKFLLPATAEGIRRYLSSGLIKGIGGKRAKMIVDHFGERTLDILDNHSARLTEIPGFGKKTLKAVREAWKEHAERREVLVFFQGLGISLPYCQRVFKQYGADALRMVKEDPYKLAEDVDGIGFLKADNIARHLGIGIDDIKRLRAGALYSLNQLSCAGHACYPRPELLRYAAELLEVSEEQAEKGLKLAESSGLIANDRLVLDAGQAPFELAYDRRLFVAETKAAVALLRLARAPYNRGAELTREILTRDKTFNPEQIQAIENVRLATLSIITGGPGVGKTTVIAEIVRRARKARLKIAMAAPTGRAAKRVTESTGETAATIHRLLKWDPAARRFAHDRDYPLAADLLVVDEVSMLDIELARHLFQAIKPGTTVVLVGDVDQLPSVGPGDVLNDLVRSGLCPVTRLTRIYRQDSNSLIIPNAHAVNQGRMPDLRPAPKDVLRDFYWIERDEPEKAVETIVNLAAERVPRRFRFDPFRDIQVLTPMNRGPCGTETLNNLLREAVNAGPKPRVQFGELVLKTGDKVMQIVNNYDKGVFNGDIGRVSHVDAAGKRFLVAFDIGEVVYKFTEAAQLRLAYAVTIHKSQGCEFPVVIAPFLTSHYVMLRRNLLYTAMTRAKRLLILVGSVKAIGLAVNDARIEPRFSGLVARLRQTF